jgi:hypothetical protein
MQVSTNDLRLLFLATAISTLLTACTHTAILNPAPDSSPAAVVSPAELAPSPTIIHIPAATSSPMATAPSSPAHAAISPAAQSGKLAGRVTIGPIRPGPVRIGETPVIPPEAFAARTIQIMGADGKSIVADVKIRPDGTYSVDLAAGNYVISLAQMGIDRARNLPKVVTIENGKTLLLDIDIDTGIR